MYELYYSRKDKSIKLKKIKIERCNLRGGRMEEFTSLETIVRHNDCILYCQKRLPLLKLAREIKMSWLKELSAELDEISEMKI